MKHFLTIRNLRSLIKPVLFIIIAVGGAYLVEFSYNLVYNGVFSKSSMTGLQLAKDALYVSDMSDLQAFENEPYYMTIKKIYQEMDKNKLFSKYRFERDANMARYLASAVNADHIHTQISDVIYWHVLARQLYHYYEYNSIDTASWDEAANSWARNNAFYTDSGLWISVNKTSLRIFFKIVHLRAYQYIKLILSKLKNEVSVFEMLTYILLFTLSFLYTTRKSTLILLLIVSNVMNVLLIIATINFQPRLTFYTYTLQPIVLLFLTYDFILKVQRE